MSQYLLEHKNIALDKCKKYITMSNECLIYKTNTQVYVICFWFCCTYSPYVICVFSNIRGMICDG